MKKVIKLFTIVFLITLTLVGCSDSNEGDSKKVAEKFVRNLHTVDAQKVDEYNKLGTVTIGTIGLGVPTESNSGPSEEYIKAMQSLDKNIQHLMTTEGYTGIVADKFNFLSPSICARDNYTSQVTEFILGENIYENNKDKNKVRYPYEIKLQFIPTDGTAEKSDASKGVIELIKENDQWKVSMYIISVYPKLN